MIQFTLNRFPDGNSVLSAFINGELYTIAGNNRMFDPILEKLRSGDESVAEDFDLAALANKKFHAVTDRVSIREGVTYFDDNPVPNTMSELIVSYLYEGNDSVSPLVKFLERLDRNPSFNSREQLWRFVERNGIHIADDGRMVMYKGVANTDTPGTYQSINSGRAFVNGEEQNGQIVTKTGDVVTMPRREISDNPNVACHAGLHCGARSYAESFAPILITVMVDPEHVVSVPNDSSDRKVRVCEYEIMDVLGSRQVDTVRWQDNTAWDEDDYELDEDDEYYY